MVAAVPWAAAFLGVADHSRALTLLSETMAMPSAFHDVLEAMPVEVGGPITVGYGRGGGGGGGAAEPCQRCGGRGGVVLSVRYSADGSAHAVERSCTACQQGDPHNETWTFAERWHDEANNVICTRYTNAGGQTRVERTPIHDIREMRMREQRNRDREIEFREAVRYDLSGSGYRSPKEQTYRRARNLLLAHLNPTQREMFERHDSFYAKGGTSGTEYLIHNNSTHNVHVRHKLGTTAFCAVLTHSEPLCDQLLAQKLMIEHHEGKFLGVAIISGVWPPGLYEIRETKLPDLPKRLLLHPDMVVGEVRATLRGHVARLFQYSLYALTPFVCISDAFWQTAQWWVRLFASAFR